VNHEERRSGEVYFLGALLLLLGAVLSQALQLEGVFQGEPAGPGSLAQLMVVSALLLVLGIARQAGRGGIGTLPATLQYLFSRDVIMLLAAVIIYGLLVDIFGFEITTFLFLLGTMYMLDNSKLRQKAIISFGTVATIVVLFTFLFEVVLP